MATVVIRLSRSTVAQLRQAALRHAAALNEAAQREILRMAATRSPSVLVMGEEAGGASASHDDIAVTINAVKALDEALRTAIEAA